MICPNCNGWGFYFDHGKQHEEDGSCIPGTCPIQVECEICKGTGKINQ
jgi:DnaJ-class molecular chaperone